MFFIANFIDAVAGVLDLILNFYMIVMIVRAVLSWVNPDPLNPIVRFLHTATDPVLSWIRQKIPAQFSGIDFSPMIVIVAILFIQSFLVASLHQMAGLFR